MKQANDNEDDAPQVSKRGWMLPAAAASILLLLWGAYTIEITIHIASDLLD